ncbi:hypothetical protein N0V90_008004 [Kalmusia sp. IMI 367209]|nr:hypothetical protein N0V90_008004 [Kalmusia sp. IMI 367209]
MALIRTELWLPKPNADQRDPSVQAKGCIVLSFPSTDDQDSRNAIDAILGYRKQSHTSFVVPLDPTPTQISDYKLEVQLFGIHYRQASGLNMGNLPSVAAALPDLKKFLGIKQHYDFTLFRCTPDTLTRTDKNLVPLEYIGSPALHGYTDQQPIHIASLSSVHDLSVVCRTSRCTMLNVDSSKGTFDTNIPGADRKKGKPQPSATLVKHRTVEDGNKAALGYLGMHCVPEDSNLEEAAEEGLWVEVGDVIEVLEYGEHLYGSTGNDY